MPLTASSASAAFVGVYGSPTYSGGSVNDAGTAVGTGVQASAPDKGSRAIRYGVSGAVELGHLGTDLAGFTNSAPGAVNASGTVVGSATKYGSGTSKGTRAVRWEPSGTDATELGNLGTDSNDVTSGRANAVNDAGVAVGEARKYVSFIHKGSRAVRWNPSGNVATELGHLGTDNTGYTYAAAFAINAGGTAVGTASKYNASGFILGERAVRWDASETAAVELGHLGTDAFGATITNANAINNAGIAVGYGNKHNVSGEWTGIRAIRWGASGAATELGHWAPTAPAHQAGQTK